MATTTPNFGWTVPTSSDLVKNGATAIETLGDAIDASLVDLKGGTTGQVLSKASNTDMDFSWSAASSGGAFTLISTTTLSGASVTLSSIPSTYKDLYAIAYGVTNAGGAGFFRIAPNGTTNITTLAGTYNNGTTNVDGSQNGYLQVGRGNATTGGANVYSIAIENYASTSNYKPAKISGVMYDSGGANDAFDYVGGITTNTAITSLVISHSGGNFNAGTIKLYGVN